MRRKKIKIEKLITTIKGSFGFAISITHNSIFITHNSKMVRPMVEKSVWILFPVFASITQFYDFWMMSYGNWKHILGVFSFQNSDFNGILVIKHTHESHSQRNITLGATFHNKCNGSLIQYHYTPSSTKESPHMSWSLCRSPYSTHVVPDPSSANPCHVTSSNLRQP